MCFALIDGGVMKWWRVYSGHSALIGFSRFNSNLHIRLGGPFHNLRNYIFYGESLSTTGSNHFPVIVTSGSPCWTLSDWRAKEATESLLSSSSCLSLCSCYLAGLRMNRYSQHPLRKCLYFFLTACQNFLSVCARWNEMQQISFALAALQGPRCCGTSDWSLTQAFVISRKKTIFTKITRIWTREGMGEGG